jgi:hypothetical protein
MTDPTAENDALAALDRLADQAWHTAGDMKGRELVHEDRATVLGSLGWMTDPAERARLREWSQTCVMCRVEEGKREPAVMEVMHPREGGGYPACEAHAARLGWERGPLTRVLPPDSGGDQ